MAAVPLDKWMVRRYALHEYGIVIRDITHRDARTPSREHRKLPHVAAYHGYAFGPFLGVVVYCPRTGQVKLLSVAGDASGSKAIISSLLESEVALRMGRVKEAVSGRIGEPLSQGFIDACNTSRTETLDFIIQYQPMLAGEGHETPCGLYIYPSCSFGAQREPLFIPAAHANGHQEHRLTIETDREYVSERAAFNVDAYANFVNPTGMPCRNQAGFVRFRLVDLVKGTPGKVFQGELVVPNSKERAVKGTVVIKCVATSLRVNPDPAKALSMAQVGKIEMMQQKRVVDYIQTNRAFYSRFPASASSVETVTVFSYDSRTGKMPGCMFDCFQIPPSKEEFYLNCLLFSVQRRSPFKRLGLNDLETWVETHSDAEFTNVIMDMLCIYVNYCSYITDEVDHNSSMNTQRGYDKRRIELMESFDPMRCRDAGDCEDFTRELLIQVCEIKVNGPRVFTSKVMKAVIDIVNRYMFVSILCGVSKGSMSFSDSEMKGAKLNGHECGLAIPHYIFFKALSRSNPHHPLLSLYTEEERSRGREGGKLYVLEGTGNLFPEPEEESELHEKLTSLLCDDVCVGLAREIDKQFYYNPRHRDNFYKMIITLLAPEPFLLKGYRGFEYLACIEHPPGSGRLRRGVRFDQLLDIDNNAQVQLVEAPEIPLKTFRAATRVDADNFPPMMLHPAQVSTEMEEIAAVLTTCSQQAMANPPTDVCTVQLKFCDTTMEKALEMRHRLLRDNLRSVCYVEAVKHSMGVDQIVGGYSLTVFAS
jgi:hypothetical protein